MSSEDRFNPRNNDSMISGTKRSGQSLASFKEKRVYSPPDADQRGFPTPEGGYSIRWLIESSVCARVLGPGGKRLKHMKEITRDPTILARISPQVQDAEYRIFNCAGSAMGISKVAGLLVRYIYDEPENEHSHAKSYRYDLKLLVPGAYVQTLVGPDEQNLREIEERSNAIVDIEKKRLVDSDEYCLHVFGVADAVQIAVYFTLETMKNVEKVMSVNANTKNIKFFNPSSGVRLNFEAGKEPDLIPRTRLISSSGTIYGSTTTNGIGNGDGTKPVEPAKRDGSIELPPLEESSDLSQNIYTAYDIARDSKRSHLRQVIKIDSALKGTASERSFLMENIRRVTNSSVTEENCESWKGYMNEDGREEGVSFIIEGPPEENSLAILLIHRFLINKKRTSKLT